MADVYRARDTTSRALVALKLLIDERGDRVQRLDREARLLQSLKHPAIVRYVAHDCSKPGSVYLAMEWLDGITLGEHLRRGALDPQDALSLGFRVAEALEVAHAAGVTHRDIKPSNLLLVGGRIEGVKVLDFGIAHARESLADLTATGRVLGTPEYMSPEQARGESGITASSDVYSLGAVLFKCVTGRPPFQADHALAVLGKIAFLPAPPRVCELVTGAPVALDEVLAELLSHSAQERPSHGGAAAHRLRAALEQVRRSDAGENAVVRSGLSTREVRPVAVILADLRLGPDRTDTAPAALPDDALEPATPPTREVERIQERATSLAGAPRAEVVARMRLAASPYAERVEVLLDGAVAALVTGGGSARDLAVQASRCALSMHAAIPDCSIAVASGEAVAGRWADLGSLFDAAAGVIRDQPAGVHIDERTAAVLPTQFVVRKSSGARTLAAELVGEAPTTVLLGRRTSFLGRDRLVRQLEATVLGCFDECASEAVLLTGEAGLGKSRLAIELCRRLARSAERPRMCVVRCDPTRSQVPYRVAGDCVRTILSAAGDASRFTTAEIAGFVATRAPDGDAGFIAEFLAEIAGIAHAGDPSPALRAARGDPELMAEQKKRAFQELLTAVSALEPLLLLVDDLQWADATSVQLIGEGLDVCEDLPLVALLLARPASGTALPGYVNQHIRLEPLRAPACERLVAEALADTVDTAARARLAEQSAGNPFYLEELIRSAARGDAESLPSSVIASAQMRLARLPDQARRVLRAASVFGQRCWVDGISHLLGRDLRPEQVDEWLVALDKEEIVQRQHGGAFAAHIQYAFRHDLIREAAYQTLTDEDRTTGHRLAGSWLQQAGETDPVVLAEHFAGGGAADQAVSLFERAAEQVLDEQAMEELEDEPTDSPNVTEALTKAATYYRRAAQTAMQSYANESAISFFERSVALWAFLDRAEAAKTRLELAEVRERVGLRRLALEDLERAEEDASADMASPKLLVRVLLKRSGLQRREESDGALERAGAVAERARELAESAGERSLEGEAVTLLAQILMQYQTEESSARAVRYAEMALELSRDHGHLGVRLWRLGNAFMASHDLDRATHLYDEALALAERAGDDSLMANCLGNMAMVAFRSWRLDEAIDSTKKALELDKRIGYRTRILESTLNLGTFYQVRGDTAAARPLLLEALADARGDWMITTLCQESLADLERNEGREDSAQRYLLAAARLCEKVGVPQKQAVYFGLLAESYWAVGKARLALESLESAVEVGEGLTLSHAFILLHLGQYDEAQEWLERFQEHEPDPDRRASARLALARLHWWAGDPATAQKLCAEALEPLLASKIKRFYLPAQALAACIANDPESAIGVLASAKQSCAPFAFPDVALDVGTLLVESRLESGPPVERYLWLTADIPTAGVGYRVADLRSRIYRRINEPDKALASLGRARSAVRAILDELPETHRELFEQHEWVRELQQHRLVP